jgi:hypothetical protein
MEVDLRIASMTVVFRSKSRLSTTPPSTIKRSSENVWLSSREELESSR